ncbi:hypothetical protein DICPUDRAFT_149620 [Dictyostelium purpureum]|uniref:Superoxide dismutase copper/zinc binding domain-containing protein n=1 Tax=Dictyostelium purpureum TaxID=5786 RepID=F0ZE54_DICPU|nr:uncharacterized protein DICPUDRAFT_149620 [Dictyostelium purpureum]EGC37790.1 hypothetical protein DICPUDRAFT_149620 [Dictyostelium purpureum]|eukprot:XP_003285729.1 hypothetical protein DICPUDRAFT_149620 [Dictyostelium purpureum]
MKFISSLFVVLLFASVALSTDYQFATCVFGPFNEFPGSKDLNGGIQIFKKGDDDIQFLFEFDGVNGDGNYAAQILTYGLHTSTSPDLGEVYNPDKSEAGCPTTTTYRLGDLGDIEFVNGKISNPLVQYKKPSISDDINSIIGRSIAIYSGSYDCNDAAKSVGQIINYCTVGVGNLTFVSDEFNTDVDPKVDTNSARSYSKLDELEPNGVVYGLAKVFNTSIIQDEVEGKVFFKTLNSSFIQVSSQIVGLSYQAHGFHIHEFGERSDLTGYAVGGHWRSEGQVHALPENETRHNGDMGNFCAFSDDMNLGYYKIVTDYIRVSDLIGRGMAVHNSTDMGNANVGGPRCAQGVIALINPKGGDAVQLPSEDWVYDVICPHGAYKGGASSYSGSDVPTDSSSNEPSSASTISSIIGLVIASIISTIIFF